MPSGYHVVVLERASWLSKRDLDGPDPLKPRPSNTFLDGQDAPWVLPYGTHSTPKNVSMKSKEIELLVDLLHSNS